MSFLLCHWATDVYDVTGEEQIFHIKNRPTQQTLFGKPSSDVNGLVLTFIPVYLTDPSQAFPASSSSPFARKGANVPLYALNPIPRSRLLLPLYPSI